jgi:hypothetical protein
MRSGNEGCFVDGCESSVEWAGWWYRASGARHLTESCGEHSDHPDFTPVTRRAARGGVHETVASQLALRDGLAPPAGP